MQLPGAAQLAGPLTIELVPATCWYTNVRSQVSAADWELCKAYVRERSGSRCEVCGGRGPRWPVECHEIWSYEEDRHVVEELGSDAPVAILVTRTQRLLGLIALCPDCHLVKHIGRAEATGQLARALRHLRAVNGWTHDQAYDYVLQSFRDWEERSQHEWSLDISVLTDILGP